MTDQRLRELLEERVADTTTIDLAAGAWERASAVRRRRRAIAGAVVAVVAVVGTTTVVVSGGGDEPPPPADNTTGPPVPGPKAERAGKYAGVPVWWAPSVDEEGDLPELTGTALPPEIDLSADAPPVPAGMRTVGLFQRFGEQVRFNDPRPSVVLALGADGTTYSLDVSRVEPIGIGSGLYIPLPVVSSESLSPDGRFAFFVGRGSLHVYDFEEAAWTQIPAQRSAAMSADWTDDGEIRVPVPTSNAGRNELYSPSGESLGTSIGRDLFVGPTDGDEIYGSIVRQGRDGARGMLLAGPVADTDLIERQSVDALGAGGESRPEALLAFPRSGSDEGLWLRCCNPVGWLDARTVLFESRHEDARILAWRVGTPGMWRVTDIRGWTPGEESYIASFAAVDGSVEVEPTTPDIDADAEFQGVPVWWSPDLAGEADLPWLDQSVLPREIDVPAAVQIAPEVEPGSAPFDRAVAAFPYPNPQRPEWVLLIGPDQALAKVDVSRLESWRDTNAPYDLATRNMLAPDGRHLVFAQDGRIEVVTLATGEWHSFAVDGAQTAYFTWADQAHVLLARDTSFSGPLYTLGGRRVIDDSGASPVSLFERDAITRATTSGPWKISPNHLEAQVWDGGLAIPVRDEGSGRYTSSPQYLSVAGPEAAALAFMTRTDGASRVIGPMAAGWLDDDTVVYESETDAGHFLVAWRIGTPEFWKVSEIEHAPGTFLGGPSFADLSP
jgi:hypothetical protein